MPEKQLTGTKAEFRVEIEPLNARGAEVEETVASVEKLRKKLQADIRKHVPGARLRVRRALELPILHHITRMIFEIDWQDAGRVITNAAVSLAVKEALQRLREKLDVAAKAARVKGEKKTGAKKTTPPKAKKRADKRARK
jgi:hypothetical protein